MVDITAATGTTPRLSKESEEVIARNSSKIDDEWRDRAEDLFLNLNTPRSQIFDFIQKRLDEKGQLDFMDQLFLQDLLQARAQAVSFFSNMLKTLHETAMSVIRNLR